jgi:hypothetical protein
MPSLIQKTIARYPVAVMAASIILFMGLQAVFSFCGKKTCFAFNNAYYDSWFPYKQKQSIVFASGSELDTLKITFVDRSKQEEISMGYGTSKCSPRASSSGGFNQRDSITAYSFSSDCYLEENATNPRGNLRLKGFAISWQSIADTGITLSAYSSDDCYSRFQESFTINGASYSNVQVITPNENGKSSSGISNVYIAKNMGIIGFEEYPSGLLWIKQ